MPKLTCRVNTELHRQVIGARGEQLDQTRRGENVMPLLCQEACNLLVAEARAVVKGDSSAPPDE